MYIPSFICLFQSTLLEFKRENNYKFTYTNLLMDGYILSLRISPETDFRIEFFLTDIRYRIMTKKREKKRKKMKERESAESVDVNVRSDIFFS